MCIQSYCRISFVLELYCLARILYFLLGIFLPISLSFEQIKSVSHFITHRMILFKNSSRTPYLSNVPILVRLGEWTKKLELYMAPSDRSLDFCLQSCLDELQFSSNKAELERSSLKICLSVILINKNFISEA